MQQQLIQEFALGSGLGRLSRPLLAGAALMGVLAGLAVLLPGQAAAQATLQGPPANAPAYFPMMWHSAMNAPLPALMQPPAIGPVVPANELDPNRAGLLGTYQPGGPTVTATNAFFQSLGTNGRTCATCHLPSSGMSISHDTIAARFAASGGLDPLFAPVDGANCPNAVPVQYTAPSMLGGRRGVGSDMRAAHSLILNRGVFRIFLPVPASAEFSVQVVSDPNGCNTDPNYNQVVDAATGQATQILSNYRRPVISTNLKFKTTAFSFGPPVSPPPPSGNIMWDGREPTLESQAIDATLGHAQALTAPTPAQVAQMVAFETGIYSAQAFDFLGGDLTALGATGGPIPLATDPAGIGGFAIPGVPPNPPVFSQYSAWASITGNSPLARMRASIYRGQQIYDNKLFMISNVQGFNNLVRQNPFPGGTCGSCHSQVAAGSDTFPNAQHDLGVAGDVPQFNGPYPAADLPVFRVTCNATATPGYQGPVVLTNDLGRAGVSGLCADIGLFTVPQLRALASHPPYFHDGSAQTLRDVVNFYNQRFSIGFTEQEKTDLVNFLNSL